MKNIPNFTVIQWLMIAPTVPTSMVNTLEVEGISSSTWNELPEEMVKYSSLEMFKRCVNMALRDMV